MKEHASRTPAVQAKKKSGFFNKKGPGTFFGATAASAPFFQAKLTVGEPNDVYEKEADATADKVVQRLGSDEGQVQRKGGERKDQIQAKPIFDSKADPMEEPVRRKEASSGAPAVTPSVESGLRSSGGGGSPLAASTREQMESGFGADLSGVRIHNDSKAREMSNDLHAQAFTHGNDIYFNTGKYDPGSKAGKHLLAHEITHVMQQGGGKAEISRKAVAGAGSAAPVASVASAGSVGPVASVAGAASVGGAAQEVIHRATTTGGTTPPPPGGQDIKDLDEAGIEALKRPPEGYIKKTDKGIEIHFLNMPAKQYAQATGGMPIAPYTKPNRERDTHQGKVWRDAVLPKITASLDAYIKDKKVTGTTYLLKVTNNKSIGVSGTVDQIAKQLAVPVWDLDHKKASFQIEHKIDWQIAGGGPTGSKAVDVIDNLLLLDAATNMQLGGDVYKIMNTFYSKIMGYYGQKQVTGLKTDFEEGKKEYQIVTDSLNATVPVHAPMMKFEDFDAGNTKNPFSGDRINMTDMAIAMDPTKRTGLMMLHTAKSGAGNIARYNDKNAFIETTGDAEAGILKSITILNIVKDEHGHLLQGAAANKSLTFYSPAKDHWKVNTEGYAPILKDRIRGLEYFSDIDWTDIDFNPDTGWSATGTVKSKLHFLDGVALTIELEDSKYTLNAEITSDKLRDNLPRPLQPDFGSLFIRLGSDLPFTFGGEIGFSIGKIGKGTIQASVTSKGWALGGKFIFDKQYFKGDVTVGYEKVGEEGHWSFGGTVTLNGKPLKGIESLTVKFSYNDQGLYGEGEVKTTLKAIESVTVKAQADNSGTLTISGNVQLGKLPKLKGGDCTFVITRKNDEWDANINGKLKPDLDIDGLTVNEVDVSYSHGIFEVNADAHYEKGKIKGDFKAGVTNKPVTEDGKKTEGDFLSTLSFFADGTIMVNIADGIGGAIGIHLKPEGDLLLDGKVELTQNKPLFELPPVRRNVFSFDKDIPLASCVVVTLSLNIHGGVDLYANMQPLVFDQGSYIGLNNVSLKNFKDASIDAHLSVSAHLDAGVIFKLGIALQADLLKVIKARVGGEGTLDFRAIEADAKATIDAGWSPDQGIKLKDGQLDLSLTSKLIASLSAKIRIFADLWVKEIDIWSHEWELGSREYPLNLFGSGKISIPLPIGNDGKVALTADTVHDKITELGSKVNENGVMESSKNVLNNDGKTTDDKQSQSNSMIKQAVLDEFHKPARFAFVGNSDYLHKRFSMYRDLQKRAEDDSSVDLKDLSSEITKCEREEYEKFKDYLLSSTFDQATKLQMIDDFMDGHPTLYVFERATLTAIVNTGKKI